MGGKPYSLDLRNRVLAAIEGECSGISRRAVGRHDQHGYRMGARCRGDRQGRVWPDRHPQAERNFGRACCLAVAAVNSFCLLRSNLRPKSQIAELRAHLPQRERLLEYGASHIRHTQKALTEMNV